MNKIEDAIYQVHYIDNNSNNNNILNKIHPLVKLIISIVYILFLTSINKYNLTITLAMSIYLIVVSIIGNLSIKNCIKRLKIVLFFLIIIGIANPILDRQVVTSIGIIPITTGMISALTLILKGIFAIISSYFLIITTGVENICYALKKLHIPNILITIFMLIYRYIIVLLKEVQKIWIAYSLRAPKQKGIHFKAWGSMIGSLMIRSIDKAEVIYQAMELRGFSPDNFLMKNQKIDKTSIIYFMAGFLLLLIIRFVPIFDLIGNVFVH